MSMHEEQGRRCLFSSSIGSEEVSSLLTVPNVDSGELQILCLACRSLLNSSTTLQQGTAIMATLQSVRLGPQGRPQNGTSLRVEVN